MIITEEEEIECTCITEDHEPHACPYQVIVLNNDDPEFCTCCPACTAACEDEI